MNNDRWNTKLQRLQIGGCIFLLAFFLVVVVFVRNGEEAASIAPVPKVEANND